MALSHNDSTINIVISIIIIIIIVTVRGVFKEWPLVQWPRRPLPYGSRRPLMKINKKICITAAKKQDFYSLKPPGDAHGFLK